MLNNKITDVYDDGNIPEIDLPQRNMRNVSDSENHSNSEDNIEPLPESSRPRKDGPGGSNTI